jgi:hypothetical protein
MRPDPSPPRRHGGLATALPEHAAELVKAYKPYPAVYTMELDLLNLDPRQTMMDAPPPALRGSTDTTPG